ncbi:MAG: tRNA modification GTPase [Gammaproteobacteria bacterium]|jgi:tRNA modification GTPase
MPLSDTIVALSTPVGESAIAVIRLSGSSCSELAQQILKKDNKLRPRVASFGTYWDVNGNVIDDCIVTYFEMGKSFTGEAMLEIAPHGNPLIIQKIIEDLIARGCRSAEPGEFTRTAFLNGKMDLSQAEAVSDLIRARSERSIEVARRQLHGSVGRKMSELTDQLLDVIAQIEAYIDFPEEDLPEEEQTGPVRALKGVLEEISDIIDTQHYTSILHEGLKTLIVGEPNVGKSSLINALTGSDRSIVSNLPGTTRDYVSAPLMLGSWRIELLDTAGLHKSNDVIEQIGISHTIEQAETADFFLLVIDASTPSPSLPDSLLSRMNVSNTILIENKIDLVDTPRHDGFMPKYLHTHISLKIKEGISPLRDLWLETIERSVNPSSVDGVVVNARHAGLLEQARKALELAFTKMKSGELSELIAADLRDALESIGNVVGKVDNERMLDRLFKQFCIGK